MLYFVNDYMEGAHPQILKRLAETNLEQTVGYGEDPYCLSAARLILDACGCPEGEVYFLTGGTQTNAVAIDSLLRSWQGVVAADTGHIATHEAGAIEWGGHKVIALPNKDGKLTAGALEACLATFWGDPSHAHMPEPGMAYISHPTESGTLYTRAELQALRQVCDKYHIPLYLDGARLGYGLAVPDTDVTLEVIAQNCHAFYIGGTKVGALFGEALVFPKKGLVSHFLTSMKQHGALLAKGRLLGVQFEALFTDGLYFQLGSHAIAMAQKLRQGFLRKGYTFYADSPTNQLFLLLEDAQAERLAREVQFCFWAKPDSTHTAVRFATSWATREEAVDALIELL